jgi:hypothetical protein
MPGDERYAAATAIWAKPVGRLPRAIVHCRTPEDVQSAIRAARDADLPLSALVVCVKFSKRVWQELGKKVRLVHKRPEGEVAAAGALQGHSSGAGAKPERPVCEQAVAFTLRRPPTVGVVFFVGEAFPCSSNEDPLSSLRGFRPPAPESAAGSSPDWERFG